MLNGSSYIHSYNIYECCGKQRSHKEQLEHLKTVHHIPDTTKMKAEKKLLKQRDGLEWFEAVFEWKLEDGSKFKQYVRMNKTRTK